VVDETFLGVASPRIERSEGANRDGLAVRSGGAVRGRGGAVPYV
jgi:hypothetical protein